MLKHIEPKAIRVGATSCNLQGLKHKLQSNSVKSLCNCLSSKKYLILRVSLYMVDRYHYVIVPLLVGKLVL